MHSNLDIAVGECKAVEGIIDILAPRWVDAYYIYTSKIFSDCLLLLGDGELFPLGWQAGVCGLTKLSYFNIMLKKNSICFCPVIADIADSPYKVAQGIPARDWPFVKANHDPLVSELLWVCSANVEGCVLIISRHERAYFERSL